MKHLFTLILFLSVSLLAKSQCKTEDRPWAHNPMMLPPTIYVTGPITDEDRKQVMLTLDKKNQLNAADGRCAIMQVSKAYIRNLDIELKQQGRYGKQYFAVVETLQEAYDMDAGCKPMVFYVVKE